MKFPSHTGALASAAPPRQVPRRGGYPELVPVGQKQMSDTMIVAPGFNGPRLSGNGGYVGGMLARRVTERVGGEVTVEITLRAPVPIDRTLQLVREGDALLLRDDQTLVCEARAGSVSHLKPP